MTCWCDWLSPGLVRRPWGPITPYQARQRKSLVQLLIMLLTEIRLFGQALPYPGGWYGCGLILFYVLARSISIR